MNRVRIHIYMDNAAFEESPKAEIETMLELCRVIINNNSLSGIKNREQGLRDSNGNTCGFITWDKTPEVPERTKLYVLDFGDSEQLRIAKLLKSYFDWLGTDREDISGAEVIEELTNLYKNLGGTSDD